MLYTLTGGGSWFPGHTGIFLGTQDAASRSNVGDIIIESTPRDTTLEQFADGVQFGRLEGQLGFKLLGGQHIYLGARRPFEDLTEDDRDGIARWAVSKLGVSYSQVGGPFLFSGGVLGGISCVGLTEGAYESIGKSIVPAGFELFLLPLTQFNLTAPVHDITMKVGDKLEMPVYGAVKPAGESLYFDTGNYTITMETDAFLSAGTAVKEGRAKFEAASRSEFKKLTFEPIEAEAGRTLIFRFKLNAPGIGEVTETFFVSVTNQPTLFVRQDPPVIFVRTSRGNLDAARLTVPPSGTEARVRGPNSSTIRLFWDPPPAQLQVNRPFNWTINADNGTAPAEQRPATTTPPLLQGQIGRSLSGTPLSENAAAGYELVEFVSLTQRTYRLIQKPLAKPASIIGLGQALSIDVTLNQGPTLLEGGEVNATITWFYKPAP